MKLTTTAASFKSNVEETNTKSFGIGDEGMVIEILRNRLYRNKIQTLVQEYISNARDANREIGQTRKIEITVPNWGSPDFKVRDFGPGITPDRMNNVFTLFGASTKRSDNKQTGGFGIGAKSAWAYTDSFMITTFIDGIKRIYIAHIGANKNGRMDMLSEESTQEPNGTEISINVKGGEYRQFQDAITRATMFWSDAEFPKFAANPEFNKILHHAREIGTKRFMDSSIFGIMPQYVSGAPVIVIDGIPYAAPQSFKSDIILLQNTIGTQHFVLHVPNGLLQVSASREEIDDSDYSKKGFKQICTSAKKDFEDALKKWEDTIVDLETMNKAKELMTGFSLSTKKKIDGVSLKNGKLYMSAYEYDDNGLQKNLFQFQTISWNVSNNGFDLNRPHKYYMLKKSLVKIGDIRKYINNNGINRIQLVTVLGLQQKKVEVDGEEQLISERDEALVAQCVEKLEKLGIKNIETIVPRPEKKPRDKTASPRENFHLYKIRDNSRNNCDKIKMTDLPEKQNGFWVYYVGSQYDKQFESFTDSILNLRQLGVVESGFRITESKKKFVESDARFVEWNHFIENWEPCNKALAGYYQLKTDYNTKICVSSKIIDNILNHMEDKENDLYKAALMLSSCPKSAYSYKLARVIIQDKNSKALKEVGYEIQKFDSIIKKHMPFIVNNTDDNVNATHIKEYVKWCAEKIKNSAVDTKFNLIV